MSLLFLWNRYRSLLRANKRLLFVALFLCLSGIMCGIIIGQNSFLLDYFLDYCDNYLYNIFSPSIGLFRVFINRLIRGTFSLLLILGCCFSLFVLPAVGIFLFTVGYSFGSLIVILPSVYGIQGFFVLLLVVLPQFLLSQGIVVLLLPISVYFCRCRIFRYPKTLLFFLLTSLVFFAACAALECLIVLIFFRPFSFAL